MVPALKCLKPGTDKKELRQSGSSMSQGGAHGRGGGLQYAAPH